ncbi:MAG: YCF48-related protein, partial [Candidatus Falkowbacteria bacterium]|nr:YCF48-related protein [Candidatus Falkowbacteria bacterium]
MKNRQLALVFILFVGAFFLAPSLASAKYELLNPEIHLQGSSFILSSGSDFYLFSGSRIFEKHSANPWVLATTSSLTFKNPFIDENGKVYVPALDSGNYLTYILTKNDANSPWIANLTNIGAWPTEVTFHNGIGYAVAGGNIVKSNISVDSWGVSTTTSDIFSVASGRRVFNPTNDENQQIVLSNSHFYATQDGGASWQSFSRPTLSISGEGIADFIFDGFNSGWVATTKGNIYYTADGISWSSVYYDANTQFKSIHKVANDIFAAGYNYVGSVAKFLKTLKSTGTSSPWSVISSESFGLNAQLQSVPFDSGGNGLFLTSNSLIGASNDSGATWTYPFRSQKFDIFNLNFIDDNNGYSVGGYNNGNMDMAGEVYKTADGGNTWTQILTSTSTDFLSIEVFGPDIWVGGDYDGSLYHSTDYGQTWNSTTTNGSSVLAMHFFSSSTGLLAGLWQISKTTDGGATWNAVLGATVKEFSFPSTNIGYGVADSGTIFKTIDGGDNWDFQSAATSTNLNSIYFTSNNTGYAVGDSGTIVKTIDGGATWSATTSPICPNCTFDSIKFSSPSNGRIVGHHNSTFVPWVLETFDGGYSWQGGAADTANTSGFYGTNMVPYTIASKSDGDFLVGGSQGLLFHYDTQVDISANLPTHVNEGQPLNFNIYRNNGGIGTTTVYYQISGLDSSNTSWSLTTSTDITDGNNTAVISIPTLDNHIAEADKPFTISILPGEYTIQGSATSTSSTLVNIDTASLVVSPLSSQVTEGAATSTISVSLNSMPSGSGQVTVSLTPTSTMGYLLSTSSMLFDNTNWNIPQTTTVSAIDDQVVNGTRYATITIAVATST